MATNGDISSGETAMKERASGRWLAGMFGAVALIVAANIFVEWRMDVFGVLRDPKGRALITSRHERKAKYLLNQAYVPENFDALVIGASASMNWPMAELTGYKFYNESLEGGNATEERMIAEHALERGHFKVALVGLFPKITQVHEFEDGLDKANRAEALGSLNAFDIQMETLLIRWRHQKPTFYPDGSHEISGHLPEPLTPASPKMIVTQDPKAVADYRALVEELNARGVRTVYVIWPLWGPSLAHNKSEFAEYMKTLPQNLPAEPTIDFNTPEYAYFRDDDSNYFDEIHLTRAGSDKLTLILNERMHQLLHDQ